MGRFAPMLCALWLVGACRSPAADPPPSDDDGATPASSTTSGETDAGTTFASPLPCAQSSDCTDTDAPLCVATYDPGAGRIEAAACVSACVSLGELARACLDDEGCCGTLSCNQVDGFCAAEPVDSTSSSTGDDSGTVASTTTVGESSSSSTGSSSSGSSSSSTASSSSSTGADAQR